MYMYIYKKICIYIHISYHVYLTVMGASQKSSILQNPLGQLQVFLMVLEIPSGPVS